MSEVNLGAHETWLQAAGINPYIHRRGFWDEIFTLSKKPPEEEGQSKLSKLSIEAATEEKGQLRNLTTLQVEILSINP